MSDLQKRIDELEKTIEDLLLDQHAARIAITTLSSTWNAAAQQPGLLGDSYDTAVKSTPPIAFDNPAPEGYAEELHKRVVALLAKSA